MDVAHPAQRRSNVRALADASLSASLARTLLLMRGVPDMPEDTFGG